MRYVFAIVFSGLTAAALAGAPPQDCAACKLVEAKASCAGEAASCSGRSTFSQRRAERVAGRSAARCAAREARAEARSCAGAKSCDGEAKAACDCK